MDPRHRDGLLAGGAVVAVLALLGRRDALDALGNPRAVATGVGSALLVEWAFLRYPERLLELWERPAVNVGSALGLVGGAVLARERPRLLAAAVWGLGTYFGLLSWSLATDESGAPGRSPDA
jgi:hypothetical protein